MSNALDHEKQQQILALGRLGWTLRRVTPGDPLVLGVTVSVLFVTGSMASLAPALRAASVDPVLALRSR